MTELEPVPGMAEPVPGMVVIRPGGRPAVLYSDIDYSITTDTARDMLEAVPENTRRAYARAWGQFTEWCEGTGRVPLPATPHTVAEYTRVMCSVIGFAPATVGQALAAIASVHGRRGYKGQPDAAEAHGILRGYRRRWSDAEGRVRQRTPVLVPDLRAMIDTCDPATLAGIRDRALLLVGYNIMGRRSELSALNVRDVDYVAETGITVHIARSKTDQDARGTDVAVPYGQQERTCAVRAVRDWTAALAERGFTSGALFRPVDRHGRVGGDPRAAGHDQPRLTGHGINEIVRLRARLARLPVGRDGQPARADGAQPHSYGAHSLRAGAVTTAYAAGAPVAAIADHGRWNPKSPVVLGYIRAVDRWRDNPMNGIGL
jgi:integrase